MPAKEKDKEKIKLVRDRKKTESGKNVLDSVAQNSLSVKQTLEQNLQMIHLIHSAYGQILKEETFLCPNSLLQKGMHTAVSLDSGWKTLESN